MRKILLDECLPGNFKRYFAEHECVTVSELGLAGKKNGELLGFPIIVCRKGWKGVNLYTAEEIVTLSPTSSLRTAPGV